MSVGLVLRARRLFLDTLNFLGKSGGLNKGFVICLVGFYREQVNGH